MAKDKMIMSRIGNTIELQRNQWRGHKAFISNYDGLVDEVLKYTWTLTGGNHPYLVSSKLNISLHKFVLAFLYGKDNLEKILASEIIIEHLDNDGLNCTYENLHILSGDYNKAKAFTIDKENESYNDIPSFIVDVYYSHEQHYFQMQVFFNRDVFYEQGSDNPTEMILLFYSDFCNLFIDWLYILGCRDEGYFVLSKLHYNQIVAQKRPSIVLTEQEKDYTVIERDGKFNFNLRPDAGDKMTFVNKTSYRKIDNPQTNFKRK